MARQNKTNPFSAEFFQCVLWMFVCLLAIVLCVSNVNASNWKIGFDVSVLMYVTQNGSPFEQSVVATQRHSSLTTGLSGIRHACVLN